MIKLFLLLIALTNVVALARTVPLSILHTNDTHGYYNPALRKDGKIAGGIANTSEIIRKIKKEVDEKDGVTLILSAGDVNTGTPESDYFFAEPDFKSMNAIPYDAMVLGNHEFDNGIDKILLQKSWVGFPIISANILENKKTLFPPYTIIEKKGIRIGVLGLTTETLKSVTLAKHTQNLTVENIISTAKKYIPIIKKENVDFIIALTHIGISKSDTKRTLIIQNDDVKLAESKLDLPIIIGGHSHTLLPNGMWVSHTLIAQAGEKGEYLGRVDFNWDNEKKQMGDRKASVIRITPDQGESPEIKALLTPYEEKVTRLFDEVVGRTSVFLDGETQNVRSKETNLGNLISDIIREKAQADIAIFNGGGIRGSIPEGAIKLRDVLRVFPFKNTIMKASITGKDLFTLLNSSMVNSKKSGGAFLQVSGIKCEIKNGKISKVLINEKAVTPSQKITFATNNFVMSGGDNILSPIKPREITDLHLSVSDTFIEHLKRFRSVSPQIEGRVSFIN